MALTKEIAETVISKTLDTIEEKIYGSDPKVEIPQGEEQRVNKIIEDTILKFVQDETFQNTIYESATADLQLDNLVLENADEQTLKKVVDKMAELLETEIYANIFVTLSLENEDFARKLVEDAYQLDIDDTDDVENSMT